MNIYHLICLGLIGLFVADALYKKEKRRKRNEQIHRQLQQDIEIAIRNSKKEG